MVRTLRRICLAVGLISLILLGAGVANRNHELWRPAALVSGVTLAISIAAIPEARTYQFTAWILTGVAAAMIYPAEFLHIGQVDLRNKTLILLAMQLVMFGMGTQIRISDFVGIARMPYPVFIGASLQFTIMPLVGFALATLLAFHPMWRRGSS